MSSRYRSYLTIGLGVVVGVLAATASTPRANAAEEVKRVEFSKFISANCSTSPSCEADFGIVPNQRAWLIKSVSCHLVIGNQNGKPIYWFLTAVKGNTVGRINLRPVSLGTDSTDHTYNATEQGYLRVSQKTEVAIEVGRDGSTPGNIPTMQCSIAGDDIVLQ
jgi:hypothetical protein